MTSAAVVIHGKDGKLDVQIIRGADEEAVCREARHQGYLHDAKTVVVTLVPGRAIHYRRNEEGKFEEEV